MIRLRWRKPLQREAEKLQTEENAAVQGERNRFIAGGVRSLQSRMTTLLAAGLMIGVGAGMLAWYYTEALSRPVALRTATRVPPPEAAGGGMNLPAFAAVASPSAVGSAVPAQTVPPAPATPQTLAGGIEASSAVPLSGGPVLEPPLDRASGAPTRDYEGYPQTGRHQQASDRRLSGEVFAAGGNGASFDRATAGDGETPIPVAVTPVGGLQPPVSAGGPRENALQTLLRPGVVSSTRAQVLPTQQLLLPKGAFIDCTLETAIDSTLPGMTTCITATDTFGADGTVVLLERGTKLIGETRGDMRQGEARVFVVWTEARTPSGVVVRLDSPGTDALGRSGLDGEVNRHFWQRFGAAALVSTIDGVVQSEVQSSSHSGTVVLDPTGSEDILNDILRSTIDIPPTVRVRNGARIQVLVARDVDFRTVYELEPR